MSDVVVIGAGLSGLAAAYELERLGLDYAIIEVAGRVGGSIRTVRQDGFLLDGGPFAIGEAGDWSLLDDIGLAKATIPIGRGAFAFRDGNETLLHTLLRRISAPKMTRMAVSSVGELDGQYAVCMENGMILTARALVVATPARYAERLFYGYINGITQWLMDYHYDTVLRLSLGYERGAHLPHTLLPPDMAYIYYHTCEHPARAPHGGLIAQVGIRLSHPYHETETLVERLHQDLGWPRPATARADFWPTADPLSCYDDQHIARMAAIRALLPDGIQLIGNDYALQPPASRGVYHLADRLADGREAARRIHTWLNS